MARRGTKCYGRRGGPSAGDSEIAGLTLWTERPAPPARARLLEAIRERTAAEDSIFVWGYCPELYVLAPPSPSSPACPATRKATSNTSSPNGPPTGCGAAACATNPAGWPRYEPEVLRELRERYEIRHVWLEDEVNGEAGYFSFLEQR